MEGVRLEASEQDKVKSDKSVAKKPPFQFKIFVGSKSWRGQEYPDPEQIARKTSWFSSPDTEATYAKEDGYWEGTGLLWCALFFAIGIALYRLLPEEPDWTLLAVATVAGCVISFLCWREGRYGKTTILVLLLVSGVTIGALRSAYVDSPRLGEAMNVALSGHVLEQNAVTSGQRLLLKVTSINGLSRDMFDFPVRVRVRVSANSQVAVGDHVALKARLFPPAGPVSPGGYDFSFRAYFAQIGATGFAYGPVQIVDGPRAGWGLGFLAQLQSVRASLTSRIRTALDGDPQAGLAVALLVGDRSGISEDQEHTLRAAGLAHILAISGLHMALFAGGAYGAALLLFALFPPLTLKWPIHKWAALAALLAATAYLLLSGASVATQRSFLMIALVFLGVFVGRRALTLRSVALAGLALLLLAPERLFHPGFQMSFAAVICLVAVYEAWRAYQGEASQMSGRSNSLPMRIAGQIGKWMTGLIVTAVVAGLATGIIGAHHFGRIAPYGLLGNVMGMPVFSLLVMPMGVLALVLMPFGLAAFPLKAMAFGLFILQEIAAFTASLDGGAGVIGNIGALTAVLLVASLFLLLLLPGRFRLLAGLPLAAGATLVLLERPPDIQIAGTGLRMAARDLEGSLRLSSGRSSFVSEIWLQREGAGSAAIKSRKMKSSQINCDATGCVVLAYGADHVGAVGTRPALIIAMPKHADALYMDCQRADLIVSDLIAPRNCSAGLVLDHTVRAQHGAVSIWLAPIAQTSERHAATRPPEKPTLSVERGPKHASGKVALQPILSTELPLQPALKITRIQYAIPDPPRPWHAPGDVTRGTLRQAEWRQKRR